MSILHAIVISAVLGSPLHSGVSASPDDLVFTTCPSGEKWDPKKKKCVNDPFVNGY